jgi:cell division inhibitor SulA
MSPPGREQQLSELLAHPSVWRVRSRASVETLPTGFAALDAGLPGGGWPRHGLVEILTPRPGVGELYLLLPVLAALSRAEPARWCAWVCPPQEPFAPALAAHGVALERMLVVRTHLPLWAHEQALRSGACEIAFVWLPRASSKAIRRLQLAAEQGRTLGVLYRSQRFADVASPAMLRVMLDPVVTAGRQGARVRLLKSRGGAREAIELHWTAAAA